MIPFLLSAYLQSPDLVLSRGIQLSGPFAGVNQQYWDVTDAEIDSRGADLSIPTIFALTGSPQRKVLIRFGSLDIATLQQSKIVDGTLVLTLAENDKASLKSVKVLKRPWMSPGVSVLARRIQGKDPSKPLDPKEIPFAPGVTWNRAGGDVSPWLSPGASNRDDAESIDEKISVKDGEIRISNLGPTLQYWKTHEGENYGFLLEFSGETGIWSSTSPEARPRLELKLEKATVKVPNLYVTHEGDAVTFHSVLPIKSLDVYRGTNKTSTETSSKVSLIAGNSSKDPRGSLTRVIANFEDSTVPQEVVTFEPSAPWIKQSISGIRLWNRWMVDQSYYSFAKYGAQKYVNGEGEKDEPFLPEVHGLLNGSKMMDTMLLGGLVLPVRPTRNPLVRQMSAVDGGGLSLAQVDLLMNGKLQYPKVTLAKIVNIDDRPLENVEIKITTANSETLDLKSDRSGIFLMPKLPEGAPGEATITATLNGVTQVLKAPLTSFTDLFARGNQLAISIDLPFNMSPWPINTETNLVLGKPTSDSAKSFPAQLVGLTDDSLDTEYTLPAKGWVEVDLGRDRLLGEFVLQGEVPKQFRVKVYGTTDKVDVADLWIDEVNTEKFRKAYEMPGDLTYRPSPNTARYIRIENLTDNPAKLKGIKLFAAKKP
ncbi:MAG: hypothetical protein WCI55_08655 [Armatimonadota bacterium]